MKKKLEKIELPKEVWSEIMSACIYIADWAEYDGNNNIPEHYKEVLRKTYFQIKADLF